MSAFTDEQINTFQAFTGLTAKKECEAYLEIAGGNVETAVEIFFGGGGDAFATTDSKSSKIKKFPRSSLYGSSLETF